MERRCVAAVAFGGIGIETVWMVNVVSNIVAVSAADAVDVGVVIARVVFSVANAGWGT